MTSTSDHRELPGHYTGLFQTSRRMISETRIKPDWAGKLKIVKQPGENGFRILVLSSFPL